MWSIRALIFILIPCVSGMLAVRALAQAAPSTNPAEAAGTHKSQLDAAMTDARDVLQADILSFPLTPELTVRQFIDRTDGGSDEVVHVVENAQQRGGTRWTTDKTCEVRLEVSGADLAGALQPIVQSHAGRLPADRQAINKGLTDLKEKTFSAMGKSVGPRSLVQLRPGARMQVWRNVTESERRDAILTAKADAVSRVVQSLRPVSIGGNKTLDDALSDPAINAEIRDWIGGRPVTEILFGDDLGITLTLSAPPEELWPVVQSTLVRHHMGPPPDDGNAWAGVRAAMLHDLAPAEGRSVATPAHPPLPPPNAGLPRDPPDWANQQIDADGVVQGGGLKAARAAEAIALQKLRARVEALPLNGTTTLGEAAKVDPHLSRALNVVLRRAPATKVDYQERGVVKVRITLDLEEVWRALYSER